MSEYSTLTISRKKAIENSLNMSYPKRRKTFLNGQQFDPAAIVSSNKSYPIGGIL
jgi:hypothetical protein